MATRNQTHTVLATCCFLDLSYPFQLVPNFSQSPVSPYNPAIKAVSPIPGLLFSGLLEIPPSVHCQQGLKNRKTLWHEPVLGFCHQLSCNSLVYPPSLRSWVFSQGKKIWKYFPIPKKKKKKKKKTAASTVGWVVW